MSLDLLGNAPQARGLTDSDKLELQNVMDLATSVCERMKAKMPYAGNLYDASEDVIRACAEMARVADAG